MSATIERAKALYEEGKYLEASDICMELVKDPANHQQMWLVHAKCMMATAPITDNDEVFKEIADSMIRSVNLATSIEEAFDIWMEFLPATTLWEKKMVVNALAEVEKNPCQATFDKYNRLFIEIFTKNSTIMLPVKNQSIIPQLAADAGMTLKDAVAKYENGRPYQNHCDDAVRDELEFITATSMFEKAKVKFQAYQNTNRETFNRVYESIGHAIVLAGFVYNPITHDKRKGIADDVMFQRLSAYANWQRFLLEAKYTVDGTQVAMYTPKDNSELDKLSKVYTRMKQLDPSFQIPALPVPVAQTIAAQQKKSGCYVATAVYGSYDCPQVWTLRRYRDQQLAASWYGRAFIRTYYAVSPTLVKWFGDTAWFKHLWKPALDRKVAKLQAKGVEDTPYADRNW